MHYNHPNVCICGGSNGVQRCLEFGSNDFCFGIGTKEVDGYKPQPLETSQLFQRHFGNVQHGMPSAFPSPLQTTNNSNNNNSNNNNNNNNITIIIGNNKNNNSNDTQLLHSNNNNNNNNNNKVIAVCCPVKSASC